MKWGFPISISLLFWLGVGLLRRLQEKYFDADKETVLFVSKEYEKAQLSHVAVCIAAKNEEKGIRKTITSIKRNISLDQCYVISDGSTDRTAEIAKKLGCNVFENKRSLGKARSLKRLLKKYSLLKKYKFILFVDADTKLDKNYLKNALPFFDYKRVAALAGYAKTDWKNPKEISFRNYFIAYRARLYSALQFFYSYGQAWKYTNVSPIIPGFASMYRTSALKKITMTVKNMAIEDFNWTFQVRKKGLGLVAHHPSVFATAQDPTSLDDYLSQIERWNLGFFQAIKYNGVWFSWFWFFLIVFILEVFLATLFFCLLPFIIIFLILRNYSEIVDPVFVEFGDSVETLYTLGGIIVGVFLIDYLLTIIVAIKDRKPMLLFYGLAFIFLRIIDGLVLIGTLPRVLFNKSEGAWVSPTRR